MPYMRTRNSIQIKNSPFYGPERFTYLPGSNGYRSPAGEPLNYGGRNMRNRTHAYIGAANVAACSKRPSRPSRNVSCLNSPVAILRRQRLAALFSSLATVTTSPELHESLPTILEHANPFDAVAAGNIAVEGSILLREFSGCGPGECLSGRLFG